MLQVKIISVLYVIGLKRELSEDDVFRVERDCKTQCNMHSAGFVTTLESNFCHIPPSPRKYAYKTYFPYDTRKKSFRSFAFSGRKDQAIDLYKKGIAELEKGIEVDILGKGL